jgi:hypothetical protein
MAEIKARNHQFRPPKISVFPDVCFKSFRVCFIQSVNKSEYAKNTILGFAAFRKISKPDVSIKPGEITQWRRLKLRGKLWRYLWKAPFISPYRLKRGWNLSCSLHSNLFITISVN